MHDREGELARYYDERGVRVPRSRDDAQRPKASDVLWVVFFLMLLLACTYLSVYSMHQADRISELESANAEQERIQTMGGTVGMDPMCEIRTSSGDIIRLYVIPDPDEGQEYIVSDKGGICVRVKNEE